MSTPSPGESKPKRKQKRAKNKEKRGHGQRRGNQGKSPDTEVVIQRETVETLSLARQKIVNLSTGLEGLVNLRTLDLSRNHLTSLSGLEHLAKLEELNVYYNRIAHLDELLHLKANTLLTKLDFRLNPATRYDHYRRYLRIRTCLVSPPLCFILSIALSFPYR